MRSLSLSGFLREVVLTWPSKISYLAIEDILLGKVSTTSFPGLFSRLHQKTA